GRRLGRQGITSLLLVLAALTPRQQVRQPKYHGHSGASWPRGWAVSAEIPTHEHFRRLDPKQATASFESSRVFMPRCEPLAQGNKFAPVRFKIPGTPRSDGVFSRLTRSCLSSALQGRCFSSGFGVEDAHAGH